MCERHGIVLRCVSGKLAVSLNKNLNDKWEESQLFPELQAIVSKYRKFFDGKKPEDFCEAIV
jgi:hypothetical protein